jgi:hypothetical protein
MHNISKICLETEALLQEAEKASILLHKARNENISHYARLLHLRMKLYALITLYEEGISRLEINRQIHKEHHRKHLSYFATPIRNDETSQPF